MSNQQPLSAPVRMNQVKTEDIYQPGVPEPCIQTPVYPPTSHNLNFGYFQGGPLRFLPRRTQNLQPMAITVTQTPQLLSSTLQNSRDTMNYMHDYCMSRLPEVGFSQGGPVRFLPNRTQNLSFMAMTCPQTPQPPPVTFEPNKKTGQPAFPGTSGDLTACQLRSTSSSLQQGVAGASAHCSLKPVDTLQKRELRLMKNRDAAKKCRKRKKDFMDDLQARNNFLERENDMLKAELQCWRKSGHNLPPEPSQLPP